MGMKLELLLRTMWRSTQKLGIALVADYQQDAIKKTHLLRQRMSPTKHTLHM
jgi:hypothetical protein